MSYWPATKAQKVYRALLRMGWKPKPRRSGSSHVQLERGDAEYTWAFHDNAEIGPNMLARIAKHTGLRPEDL